MKTLQRLLGGLALISSAFLGMENKSLADTLNVPAQYSTIQSAVNASINGDEIIVSPGRYLENVLIDGKGITLRSTNPQSQNIVKSTIIDGQTSNSVITLRNITNSTATLEGLIITNGKAQYGGGINAKNSILSLDNCVVTSNSCFGGTEPAGGGGIYCENSTMMLKNCEISNNNVLGGTERSTSTYGILHGDGRSGDGGGLNLLSSKATIDNCNITSNTCNGGDANASGYIDVGYCDPSKGGGIYAENGLLLISNSIVNRNNSIGGDAGGNGSPVAPEVGGNVLGGGMYYKALSASICNCIISDNSALGGNTQHSGNAKFNGSAIGGAIYDLDSSVSVVNCTIVDNSVRKGGGGDSGVELGGGLYGDYTAIKNVILWNNRVNQIDGNTLTTQPLYSDIQNWTQGGIGNINLDPQFIDSMNANYRLSSTSPCIDNGTSIENLLTDIEGNFRPQGKASDIGAYEFVLRNNAIDSKVWNMYE